MSFSILRTIYRGYMSQASCPITSARPATEYNPPIHTKPSLVTKAFSAARNFFNFTSQRQTEITPLQSPIIPPSETVSPHTEVEGALLEAPEIVSRTVSASSSFCVVENPERDMLIDFSQDPLIPCCWLPGTIETLKEVFTLKKIRTNYSLLKESYINRDWETCINNIFHAIGKFFMQLYLLFWIPELLSYLNSNIRAIHPYVKNSLRFVEHIPSIILTTFRYLYNTFAILGGIPAIIIESLSLNKIIDFRRNVLSSYKFSTEKIVSPSDLQIKANLLSSILNDKLKEKYFPEGTEEEKNKKICELKRIIRPSAVSDIMSNSKLDNLLDKLKDMTISPEEKQNAINEAEKILKNLDIQTKKMIITHTIGILAISAIIIGSFLFLLGTASVVPVSAIMTSIGISLEVVKGIFITTMLDNENEGWKCKINKLVPNFLKNNSGWNTIIVSSVIFSIIALSLIAIPSPINPLSAVALLA